MPEKKDPVDQQLSELRELPDPVARATRAGELLASFQTAVNELSRIRRESVEDLREQGLTQAEIATALGMTRSRISQLVSAGPPPERAFLGTGPITVAIGGKLEAGKSDPGPVVSKEAMSAYDHLRALAENLGLGISYEVVPPPGMVHLNRDNLIVICGPRLSPLVSQVLESDTSLRFQKDDEGWHLVDLRAGETYRSPADTGEPADLAYLARLPRPDRQGTFLYLAGIHAMGTCGVVHYLEHALPQLYRDAKHRKFSVLVRVGFDPETHEPTSSEALTPIYFHDN